MFLTIERWEYSPNSQAPDDTLLRDDAQPCALSINVQHLSLIHI